MNDDEILTPDDEEEEEDPEKWKPSPWLTEPYAVLRVHVREYYRLQRARIRGVQQHAWLKKWYPTVEQDRLQTIEDYAREQKRLEEQKVRILAKELKHFPLWTEWMQNVRGIGPILAGNVLGEGGPPERFASVSAYWRYFGLAVVDGRTERAVEGEKRHFSRKLKTASWKIGESFKKIQGPYHDFYALRKAAEVARAPHRNTILIARAVEQGKHRTVDAKAGDKGLPEGSVTGLRAYLDRLALRWTTKVFLSHVWEKSRLLNGMPAGRPYVIEQLKHPAAHYIPPPE